MQNFLVIIKEGGVTFSTVFWDKNSVWIFWKKMYSKTYLFLHLLTVKLKKGNSHKCKKAICRFLNFWSKEKAKNLFRLCHCLHPICWHNFLSKVETKMLSCFWYINRCKDTTIKCKWKGWHKYQYESRLGKL